MKNQKKDQTSGFSVPLIKELADRANVNFKIQNACLATHPSDVEEPAALYQDAGGGYNANFVFPQE